MIKKDLVIAVLATFCLTATLFRILPTESSPAQYDPWADMNDDGTINILDIANVAVGFGTSGDPTKNVNIINWPVSRPVTVWYEENVPSGVRIDAGRMYNASGFGHLHILMDTGVSLTDAETLYVHVSTHFWNFDHTAPSSIIYVYSQLLDLTSRAVAVTIPVPNEEFTFSAFAPEGTTCEISLCFYLTWA